MFEKIQQLTDEFLEMGVPGNDTIIYKDGECIFRQIKGYSDLEEKIPMNGKELYNIYSCSKPITCVAALQLWEKGLFQLEDKLSDYMPEFAEMTVKTPDGSVRKAEKPIRIHHLFEMTAGFSYEVRSVNLVKAWEETDHRCPTRETMKYLAKDPLLFEPGEGWCYSLCHDVLAALVEVISGMPFQDYVKKNIFDPLGMDRSNFLIPEEDYEKVAAHYVWREATNKLERMRNKVWAFRLGSEYASGGAGCVSCVTDYIKFLEALRVGDKILGRDTIAFMSTDRMNEKQHLASKPTIGRRGWGLGFRCQGKQEYDMYPEFGWGGAAGSFLSVDLTRDLTIFYAQHVLTPPNRTLRFKIYQLACEELDK